MEKEAVRAKRYLFWGIIIAITVLSYLLLKDLLIAIMTSVLLAYISKPLYKKLSKKINKQIAAFLTVVAIILTIFIVLSLFVGAFINQLIGFLSRENITNLVNILSEIINSEIIKENLSAIINEIGKTLLEKIPSTISYAPIMLLNLFVIFFTTFYLLMEWDYLEKKVEDIIPFKNRQDIVKKIKNKTSSIISGTFFIAFIEFIIAAIILKLLGVGPYLILAFAIGLLAFIPALGPAIIWVPLAIIEFLYGKTGIAIGVMLMGIFLSMVIDFMLRAKILSSKTGTHPAIMLFGIIGGIKLFGFIGLIIGPLILSIFVTIIENIPKNHKEN